MNTAGSGTSQVSCFVDWSGYTYHVLLINLQSGAREQDYLVAPVDLTRIRDGDMMVTINLVNLPLPHHPDYQFVQTFALTRAKPQVTRAPLLAIIMIFESTNALMAASP